MFLAQETKQMNIKSNAKLFSLLLSFSAWKNIFGSEKTWEAEIHKLKVKV